MSKKGRKIIELDDDWKFYKDESEELTDWNAKNIIWQDITVPHDWDINGPYLKDAKSGIAGGYAPCGIGWYKRDLKFTTEINGKKIFLNFDGIYMRATFWLNNYEIGSHLYGYSPFELDITPFIKSDSTNTLIIKVDNSKQPSCRWYSGSGIYRKAWLVTTDEIHFDYGGVFAYAQDISEENAKIIIQSEIVNETNEDKEVFVKSTIYDDNSETFYEETKLHLIISKSHLTVTHEISLDHPHLWNLDDPYLYKADIEILTQNSESEMIDNYSVNFGIRFFQFNGSGFSLNGNNFNLKGVCLHHDGGCVGAAVPKSIWERRIKILKSIGCNAIRTSHNPPASDFLDCCDELGILVIDEAFDKWYLPSPRHDWVRYGFKKYWKQELTNFVRRDRNHPSIILWSLGNEIHYIRKTSFKNWQIKLTKVVKKLDPTRPITTVLSPGNTKQELKAKKPPFYGDIADVICTNYTESYLHEFHERWPNKACLSTEAYHYWRRKHPREIHLPPKEGYLDYTELNPWFDVERNDYIAGQFLWVGIEYLGEVRDPYPYHGRTNAPIRINGFIKPQAGFFKSVWSTDPYTHLAVFDEDADIPRGKIHFDFPKIVCHWNFQDRDKKTWKIVTYTNCEEVQIVLNGDLIGTKLKKDYPNNDMFWEIDYAPGELIAIGKNSGKEVNRNVLKTSGVPKKVLLLPDKLEINADGHDCIHFEARVVDENNILVPNATNLLKFHVSGETKLIGLDSGDLSSHDPYKGSECKAYWGQALLIIQSTKKSGEIMVKVESQGLIGTDLELNSKKINN